MDDKLRDKAMEKLGFDGDYEDLSKSDKMKVVWEEKRLASEGQPEDVSDVPDDKKVTWYIEGVPYTAVWWVAVAENRTERRVKRFDEHRWEGDVGGDQEGSISDPSDAETHTFLLSKREQNPSDFHLVTTGGEDTNYVQRILDVTEDMDIEQIRCLFSEGEMVKLGLNPSEKDKNKLISALIAQRKQL
jgi:hypothetical protein